MKAECKCAQTSAVCKDQRGVDKVIQHQTLRYSMFDKAQQAKKKRDKSIISMKGFDTRSE